MLPGRQRRLEQPAVAAGMGQAGEQQRVRAPIARAAQQPHHRFLGAAEIHLDVRVEVLRIGQVRIELQRLADRDLRLAKMGLVRFDEVLAEHPMRAGQPGPGRRVGRVLRDALPVQFQRRRPFAGVVSERLGAQIQLVRGGIRGHVLPELLAFLRA